MKTWAVQQPGPIGTGPIGLVDKPVPIPGPHQLRVKVSVCAVCRTDLHLAEGDLAPKHPVITPGHEVVGLVESVGSDVSLFAVGERVGVPWLASVCGTCRFCMADMENLCLNPLFTGWDVDGGYAEYLVADERFVYALPGEFSDVEAAPLLCAGIIGYRALRRSRIRPGGRLGIYGFGASAHLTAQVALARGCRVHVMTRSQAARDLALELGVASAAGSDEAPPEPLDAAILFAPVGTLVPPALAALDRGGTVAIAGIHLSDVPALDYQRHLFEERSLCSVTANTRQDGREFLDLAASIPLRVSTVSYRLEQADQALEDLAADKVNGTAVLIVDS